MGEKEEWSHQQFIVNDNETKPTRTKENNNLLSFPGC